MTSTLPPDPTSPSSTPTTRFLVSLATRVWWSTTDRSTSGCTVTSEGVARIDGVAEEEVVGAEPPSPPLAASVVIVADDPTRRLSLSHGGVWQARVRALSLFYRAREAEFALEEKQRVIDAYSHFVDGFFVGELHLFPFLSFLSPPSPLPLHAKVWASDPCAFPRSWRTCPQGPLR